MRLSRKVALVTGAGSGIGRATSMTFAAEGAMVFASDLDEESAASTAAAIRDSGGAAEPLGHDVTDEARWREVIDVVVAERGQLDVLVNNAGIALGAPIIETTYELWRRVLAVNLDGVFLGTRCAIEAMSRTGGGSIINVSSVYGLVGGLGAGAYGASKGGVRMLSKTAALECAAAKTGVRVNSVHPGFVRTPMIDGLVGASDTPAATTRAIEHMHAMDRMAEPEEVAAAILFLASDESSFVTGTELVVDGGFTAR